MAQYPLVVLGNPGTVKATDGFDLGTVVLKDALGGLNAVNLTLQGLLSYYSQNAAVVTKTANFALDTSATFFIVDATTGVRQGTLPAVASNSGRWYVVFKKDSSANALTLVVPDSATINGSSTQVLSGQYAWSLLFTDGTNWLSLHS